MEYLVFPFGKYKGVELNELPTTYVAFAIEKFDLPEELRDELMAIIYGRLRVYSFSMFIIDEGIRVESGLKKGNERTKRYLTKMKERYED